MTAIASQLDSKLAQLPPAKARLLERLVREAMTLADVAETVEAAPDWLEMQVHRLPLATADYERLTEALDQPPRDLPRLRELLREPSKLGNA